MDTINCIKININQKITSCLNNWKSFSYKHERECFINEQKQTTKSIINHTNVHFEQCWWSHRSVIWPVQWLYTIRWCRPPVTMTAMACNGKNLISMSQLQAHVKCQWFEGQRSGKCVGKLCKLLRWGIYFWVENFKLLEFSLAIKIAHDASNFFMFLSREKATHSLFEFVVIVWCPIFCWKNDEAITLALFTKTSHAL